MLKYKILGGVNIVTGSAFCYLLWLSNPFSLSDPRHATFETLLFVLLQLCALSFIAVLIHNLLFKKVKQPFTLYLAFTLVPILWLVLLFLGLFFASSIYFPLTLLVVLISIFLLVYKHSRKTALLLISVTLLFSGYVMKSGFEESYCWNKGDLAEEGKKDAMIQATREDAKALQGWDVKPGQQIGVSFRAHMLCHTTFELGQAIQESYFLRK